MPSVKPIAVQATVIAKTILGESKTQIGKDLGIARNTVTGILEDSDIERQIVEGTLACANLIPESVRVVRHRLKKNSEHAAFRILEGIGVLGAKGDNSQGNTVNLTVQIANMPRPEWQKGLEADATNGSESKVNPATIGSDDSQS